MPEQTPRAHIQRMTWPTSEEMEEQGLATPAAEVVALQMGALALSMIALFTHTRLYAWLSLILAIACVANMKMYKIRSFKDVFTTLAGPGMAVFMGYVGKQAPIWH